MLIALIFAKVERMNAYGSYATAIVSGSRSPSCDSSLIYFADRVGTLKVDTPPDYCDDQVADCCCNNIAFTLSMICLTCQVGIGPQQTGVDAGVGAYQDYLTADRKSFCSPQTNKTGESIDFRLTTDVQDGVCRNDIRISDQIYETFWSDGSRSCSIYATSQITKKFNALGKGAFTKCPNLSSSSASSSDTTLAQGIPSLTTSTEPSGSSSLTVELKDSSKIEGGAIVGIVVGVIGTIAVVVVVALWQFRKRKQLDSHYEVPVITATGYRDNPTKPHAPSSATILSTYSHSNDSTSQSSQSYYDTHSEASYSRRGGMGARHIDAGRLSRIPSGRLPPAYGDFVED
ncbi:hypothetical protein VNI00_009189 [Paramarasmius palmivorus]|uniref:Mid2 domain-containing protein n=1 Tax=Paramarasmius palmivorus TaxID=297713 RepID=A0AAW0CR89_9AGAR